MVHYEKVDSMCIVDIDLTICILEFALLGTTTAKSALALVSKKVQLESAFIPVI